MVTPFAASIVDKGTAEVHAVAAVDIFAARGEGRRPIGAVDAQSAFVITVFCKFVFNDVTSSGEEHVVVSIAILLNEEHAVDLVDVVAYFNCCSGSCHPVYA